MRQRRLSLSVLGLLLLLHGCSHFRGASPGPPPTTKRVPFELEEKVLALDPENLCERDVAEVLSKCPAPRIIALDGSVPIVSMASFARFLMRMGYPEASLRDPRTGLYSYSSYRKSRELAGMIAWYYEREGLRPILIGHSQGGMVVVRILHELAGAFHSKIPVWNPYTAEREKRETIVDPLSGEVRPVVGLRLGFASAAATGTPFRILFGQWRMFGRLRKIEDTVEEFTGFHVKHDLISGTFRGVRRKDHYVAVGSALVRNVILPESCSHIGLPLTEGLAERPETRRWIEAYTPADSSQRPGLETLETEGNIVFAAELWYSIKKLWCLELKRSILVRRGGTAPRSVYAR